jgi:hypothetical protein
MKILFSVGSFAFLRHFEAVLQLLVARGHSVQVLAEPRDGMGRAATWATAGATLVEKFARSYSGSLSCVEASDRAANGCWHRLGLSLRLSRDYWNYLEPRYSAATRLRDRAAAFAPAHARGLAVVPLLRSRWGRRFAHGAVGRLERAVPPNRQVLQLLEREAPDLVLITPLVYFRSLQSDFVRAARRLGIPNVLGVASWDNLTTKGLVHAVPDHVFVWNEAQRQEAYEIHGISSDRVTVTGAHTYDPWFTMQPTTTREAFCAQHGFDARRPILLYVCSSSFIAPREIDFVRQWVDAVRTAADPLVRSANVLIRPHPNRARHWRDVDMSSWGRVSISPRPAPPAADDSRHASFDPPPGDDDSRRAYFDSMYHSAAVVGINTSAQIESAILGRPVCTVLVDKFEQERTLHFQHLKGLLYVAEDLRNHTTLLTSILREPERFGHRSRAFVETFVRPRGLDCPGAEVFVQAMLEAATRRRGPDAGRHTADIMLRLLRTPGARVASAVDRDRQATAR